MKLNTCYQNKLFKTITLQKNNNNNYNLNQNVSSRLFLNFLNFNFCNKNVVI